MEISQRATDIQASPIRKLMPYADAAEISGVKIYKLNIGQPDIATPPQMISAYQNFNEKVLAYGPSQGLDVYRIGLVRYYAKHHIVVEKNDIIVTTAGSEAIIFAMMAVGDVGDEIIVPEPFYTNYNGFATMAGITLKAVGSNAIDGYPLPSDSAFESALTSKTKAIMICNPGNPTGTVYSKADIYRLAEFAKRHKLFLISDEVYREFVYDSAVHTSVLEVPDMIENLIMVDSVSKRYSACGARIGCMVSRNKQLMAVTLKFAQARLCPPTVDQLAANACVDLGIDFFTPLLHEYKERRDIVYNALNMIPGAVCVKPQGAFYIMVQLPFTGNLNSEDFIIWLLTQFRIDNETVMAAPGDGFYATQGKGKDELRLAYVLEKNDLTKAMRIFVEGFAEYTRSGSLDNPTPKIDTQSALP